MTTGPTTGRFQPATTGPDNHLPGKHDQSSHGRGKGGIRRSLANAKTTDEIAGVLSSEAGALVGDTFDANFAGADPQVAREFAEGVLRGVERFPATPLREVGTYGPGGSGTPLAGVGDRTSRDSVAITIRGGETDGAGGTTSTRTARLPNGRSTTSTAIYLNNSTTAGDWDRLRSRTRAFTGRADLVGTTPRAVALHEFGHSIGKHGRPAMPEYEVGQTARRMAEEAGQGAKQFVGERVSRYASTNNAELAAEAFADVMENGGKARPLSRTLFAVIQTNYDGWAAEVAR